MKGITDAQALNPAARAQQELSVFLELQIFHFGSKNGEFLTDETREASRQPLSPLPILVLDTDEAILR